MRHRNKLNTLGRKSAHRKKTLSNMASSLILHKRINTTVAKAKALRVYVEPLITKSKEDSTHSRRTVFAYLGNKYAVSELFREVSQKVADRPGGYTRILKTGFRKGDGAEMCFIELVDYNTHMLKTDEDTQQKRTRRGRRRGKVEDRNDDQTSVVTKEASTEEVAVDEKPANEAVEPTAHQPVETYEAKSEIAVEDDQPAPGEVKDEIPQVEDTPQQEEQNPDIEKDQEEKDKPEGK